ncbi:MAG TPA: glycoside hydrolase family 172 protein [Armatimonadota bacterium]|jgi:hypothetical protein
MLEDLEKAKQYEARRSSSENPVDRDNNNDDCKVIPPGETLAIAELEGPGRIAHIWITLGSREWLHGRKIVLRMYWDGEADPSVEAPINDFFCQGHGMNVEVNSMPIRVTGDGGARNCYFPMPFRRSARVEVANEGEMPVTIYWYVDWQKLEGLPEDSLYFHARYRQEYPCESGKDYVFLEAEGRGHFVGCNLSIRSHERLWWGEGDDRFYIDGDPEPTLAGTGSEDYFCEAYGIRKRDGLFYGCTVLDDTWEEAYGRTTAYRFHIPDPVPFKRSLKVAIEHKAWVVLPSGKWYHFAERSDDYSSVAYWYQTEPHKPFFALPPVTERLYPAVPTLEAESLPHPQPMGGEVAVQKGEWSGGAQLFFTPQDSNAFLTLTFPVEKAGDYSVAVNLTKSSDYGIYQVLLDGLELRRVDLYSPSLATTLARSEFGHLAAGRHTLTFRCEGKNPASASYFLGVDNIELRPVLPRPEREG